ncbi:MAG: class I SAM-dependent methyltransferase, partial [Thaumarchaeota archaeon]
ESLDSKETEARLHQTEQRKTSRRQLEEALGARFSALIGNAHRPKFWAEELAWGTKLEKDSSVLVLSSEEDSYVASFTKAGLAALASGAFEAFTGGDQHLPQADGAFRSVFIPYAWHEFHDGSRVAVECYRVLKKDGTISILSQSHEQLRGKPLFKFFPEAVTRQISLYASIPDLTAVIGKVGFKSIETSNYSWSGNVKPSEYIDAAERKLWPELAVLTDEVRQRGIKELRDYIARRGDEPFRDDDASTLVVGKK